METNKTQQINKHANKQNIPKDSTNTYCKDKRMSHKSGFTITQRREYRARHCWMFLLHVLIGSRDGEAQDVQ